MCLRKLLNFVAYAWLRLALHVLSHKFFPYVAQFLRCATSLQQAGGVAGNGCTSNLGRIASKQAIW
jgi:hypothetical protein